MLRMLERAIGLSLSHGQDSRKYRLAAVGERVDGVTVIATNGGIAGSRTPSAHAESRLARKVDVGSVVYVARALKDGQVALAKPCARCQAAMKNRGVSKCYYTINKNEYGVIYLNG